MLKYIKLKICEDKMFTKSNNKKKLIIYLFPLLLNKNR